jgi:hypothetical protein
MNERILEFAQRAGLISHFNAAPHRPDIEKFAELIVRECMTTVLKESKWYWDKDEFESANAIQNAARRVKEHFGVE